MKKYVLTVTLNPAIDTMVLSDNRKKEIISAGGKGINVARSLKTLKVPVCATGLVGGSFAKEWKRFLSKEGIQYDFSFIAGEMRRNFTIIEKNDENTRVIAEGPRVSSQEVGVFKKKYKKLLYNARMVVLSGRNAHGADKRLYGQLIRIAREHHRVPVIVDTSGQPFVEALKASPDIIKPNVQEAEFAIESRLKTKVQIKEALKKFHGFGIKVVLLSLAGEGAILSTEKEILYAKAPKVAINSDVGCGDAMVAGLLYSYLKNDNQENMLKWSVSTGSANALNLVPGLVVRKDIVNLFKKIKIQIY